MEWLNLSSPLYLLITYDSYINMSWIIYVDIRKLNGNLREQLIHFSLEME